MQHSTTLSTPPSAGLDLDRIRQAVGPVLSAHRIALVDIEWLTDRGHWTLRLTIEHVGSDDVLGGVSLDECADVSRDVSAVLDVQDLIPHHYHLEVSSPGLDRLLRTPADFSRFVGREAKLKLRTPAPDGQRVVRGTLAEAGEGHAALIIGGKRLEVELGNVAEARLVFELMKQPKKQPARRHAKRAQDADKPHSRHRSRAPHGRSHKTPKGTQ